MKYIVVGIIGLLLVAIVLVIISSSRRVQFTASPVPQKTIPTIVSSASGAAELKTYADPSGFEFQYPKGVVIKIGKPDNQIYASLELTLPNKPEIVSVKVENSDLSTVDDWFKGTKKTSIFGDIAKGKLAGLESRTFESNNLQTTIALDSGALFTITTNAHKQGPLYQTYNKVLSTFAFVQPTQAVQDNSSSGSSSDIIDEGEEIVQ